ncbi:hypothetical protein [Thermosyntropha sp.]|uniref:hypothetical protein n=1 Tax=Thermosyntropha sp. TaxID=2740820 RepID=UPI0025E4C2F3|nr:hypothetical protein [Thermosyntropha sp.]MBO8158742.1 hypothetical protein [Thermosyntropha sp.]
MEENRKDINFTATRFPVFVMNRGAAITGVELTAFVDFHSTATPRAFNIKLLMSTCFRDKLSTAFFTAIFLTTFIIAAYFQRELLEHLGQDKLPIFVEHPLFMFGGEAGNLHQQHKHRGSTIANMI